MFLRVPALLTPAPSLRGLQSAVECVSDPQREIGEPASESAGGDINAQEGNRVKSQPARSSNEFRNVCDVVSLQSAARDNSWWNRHRFQKFDGVCHSGESVNAPDCFVRLSIRRVK